MVARGLVLLRPAWSRSAVSGARCSSIVLLVTGAYLAAGLATFAAWRITGNIGWVEQFFQVPGALLLVWLAAVEVWLGATVWRHFGAGEPMRKAWFWVTASAAAGFAGGILAHVLGGTSKLNFLLGRPFWPEPQFFRQAGLFLGGPCRFALLAAGLYFALRVYRRAGLLGRLRRADWTLLLAVAAYVAREFGDVAYAIQRGKRPGILEIANWPVDPLLVFLLLEAMLLYRSVQQTGPGWIGRCWRAFSIAVMLVAVGDVGIWATGFGYLPWPWSSVTWYVWLPAAAAFALAPAYQLEAIQYARSDGLTGKQRNF